MASTWLGDGLVTLAYVGDGGTSEGDVHEAFNLAAVTDAPCIFFVQNNGWAISTPVSEQMRAASIADKGVGYGMRAVRVDGNDVAACWSVVHEAADLARQGYGPTLIEALTYRLGPHTTADDPTRYRDAAEVAEWERRDPIERVRRYLESTGVWNPAVEEELQAEAASARAAARAAVFDAPDHDPLDVFEHVFSEPTPDLLRQRDELATELEGRG